MSKARLVITAVVVEGRTQSEVARKYGVSQGWISRLVARYRLEGPAMFAPQSRRPHTSPTRLPEPAIDLIIELHEKLTSNGLDAGPGAVGALDAKWASPTARLHDPPGPRPVKRGQVVVCWSDGSLGLMTFVSSRAPGVISMRRGLALSATGRVRVSTPF